MFSFLTMTGFQPFSIAGLVLVGLCAVEMLSLMFGHSLSSTVDSMLGLDMPEADAHLHAHVPHGSVLDIQTDAHAPTHAPSGNLFGSFYDWLNAGRVPLMILLMAGLGAFAVVGLALQIVAL